MTVHAPYWPLATLLVGVLLGGLAWSAITSWREDRR